jgi:hypothetical protein
MDPTAVAEQILADLKTSPRAKGPLIAAGQLVAYHVKRHEALPAITVDALAAALSCNRPVARRAWASVDEAVEAARLAASNVPVPRKQRAVVLDAVRYISAKEYVLYGPIFDSIIRALGLTDASGRLRQQVRESITPSPKPEQRLAGVEWDDEGARAMWRERPAGPRVGMRLPDLYLKAVEVEAAARAKRGRSGEPAMSHQDIATAIETDYLTVRDWASTSQWQMDCMSRAYWKLRRPS